MTSFPRIRVIPIAAMALMLGLGAAAAQTSDDEPGLSYEEALIAVLAGGDDAQDALEVLFGQAGGDPELVAALVVELIGALEGDTLAITNAASLITNIAKGFFTTPSTGERLIHDGLVAAALAGDSGSRGALLALFNEVSSDSQAIANLAVELIEALNVDQSDPGATIDAAILISDVAREILVSQPENAFDADDILAAFETIDAGIADVLETITAAAGDEDIEDREDLLDLDDPPVDDESTVSPS